MGPNSEEGSKKLEKFKTRAQNYNPKPFKTEIILQVLHISEYIITLQNHENGLSSEKIPTYHERLKLDPENSQCGSI